jgi:hypothetical protein
VPSCPPEAGTTPDVDVDGDGTNESFTTGVSVTGAGGVTVEEICVNGSFYAVKITKPTGVEYGGGCGYLHGGNKMIMLYQDVDGNEGFTPGVDIIKEIKYWNMKAIGVSCDIPDGEARYFVYYVDGAAGSITRAHCVQDPSGKWVIDKPLTNFPAPKGPISPSGLSGVLFELGSTTGFHCVDGQGMYYLVATEPTPSSQAVQQGGSLQVSGYIVGLNGFAQSTTVYLGIVKAGPVIVVLDTFNLSPPYPRSYQRSIQIPIGTPAGQYQLVAWVQNSAANGFASSDGVSLTVIGSTTTGVPALGVIGTTLLVAGIFCLAFWMMKHQRRASEDL